VNNTTNDSFELYYGLFLYNRNATEELERLEQVRDGCACSAAQWDVSHETLRLACHAWLS
jgi:hypothetical protein